MEQMIKVMNLKTRKDTAIEKIMHLDEGAMKKLEQSLDSILNESISIEQYNRELDEAEAAIDKGEYFTQSEVEKMSKKW